MSVVGVVLAGGLGRRMGGAKAAAELDGVALVHHPLRALAAVTATRAVVAKRDTALPALPAGVARWDEPDEPRHPRTGILHALRRAGGRAVLCVAVDLPLLDAATLRRLLDSDPDARAGCVVAVVGGEAEPLCALWRPAALPALDGLPPAARMRELVAAAGALEVPYEDATPFTNVNTREELAALLSRRSRSSSARAAGSPPR